MPLPRRASAVLAVAIAAVAVAPAGARAQTTPAQGDLYVATTGAGSLVATGEGAYRLTLRDPARDVTSFSDRPQRRTSTERVRTFVRAWDDRFADDPPNAALVIDGAPASRDVAVLELSQPRVTASGALTFRAERVGGEAAGKGLRGLASRADERLPRSFGRASLFVDASSVAEYRLGVQVSGLTSGAVTTVVLDPSAQVDPFPSNGAGVPSFQAGAASVLDLARNAIIIAGGSPTPLTASLTIGVSAGSGPITGTATVPAGTTLSLSVGNATPVPVPNGRFSLPTS